MQIKIFVQKSLNAIAVIGVVVFLLAAQPASADTKIVLSHSIDIPDRTIIYENNSYEIRTMGSYHMDESVNMTVTVTDIQSYTIVLLDRKTDFLWYEIVYQTKGKDELTMPAGMAASPGTYFFAVFYQGEILAFEQVLFSNVTMNMELNITSVAPGGMLQASVTAAPDMDLPVKVVLTQGSSSLEFPLNRISSGNYETDIKIPVSASGNFSSYAAMTSGKTVLGHPELAAAAKGRSLEITGLPQGSSEQTKSSPAIGVIFIIALFILGSKKMRK
ncbi:MAG: hypothetical protein WA130_09100 [Candidatus Methanoperedens sp.]